MFVDEDACYLSPDEDPAPGRLNLRDHVEGKLTGSPAGVGPTEHVVVDEHCVHGKARVCRGGSCQGETSVR